jgi:predicted DNA-binding transcriptional regulator AlpA
MAPGKHRDNRGALAGGVWGTQILGSTKASRRRELDFRSNPRSISSHARLLPGNPLTCGYSPRANDPLNGNVTKPKTVRLVEIAELLGVTKQRAHQIAGDKGFPPPLAEDVRGRMWSRYEVQAWAKRWRTEKPWR